MEFEDGMGVWVWVKWVEFDGFGRSWALVNYFILFYLENWGLEFGLRFVGGLGLEMLKENLEASCGH